MLVTLDIFSGRPNPTWNLSEEEQRQLLSRVHGRALAREEDSPSRLGYRGLVIQASDDTVVEIPQSFRVAGFPQTSGAIPVKGERPLNIDEESEIVQFLLQSARAAMPDDLQQLVADERQRLASAMPLPPPPGPLPEPDPTPPAPPCQVVNTAYNPGFWNNSYQVLWYNNCYNYAMNWRSDTFAQPGRISGQVATTMSCADVGAAASRDGCTPTCKGKVKRVALVIWPGWDYHWYRKHSEGFWGHKPGGTAARNTDNSGRLIDGVSLTPANCDRGGYTIFCGYRYSPHGMKVS